MGETGRVSPQTVAHVLERYEQPLIQVLLHPTRRFRCQFPAKHVELGIVPALDCRFMRSRKDFLNSVLINFLLPGLQCLPRTLRSLGERSR